MMMGSDAGLPLQGLGRIPHSRQHGGGPLGHTEGGHLTCKATSSRGSQSKFILLDPLPGYVTGKCCNSKDHIINYGDANYQETIKMAVKNAHRI